MKVSTKLTFPLGVSNLELLRIHTILLRQKFFGGPPGDVGLFGGIGEHLGPVGNNGAILMEGPGFVLQEDGSFILME